MQTAEKGQSRSRRKSVAPKKKTTAVPASQANASAQSKEKEAPASARQTVEERRKVRREYRKLLDDLDGKLTYLFYFISPIVFFATLTLIPSCKRTQARIDPTRIRCFGRKDETRK